MKAIDGISKSKASLAEEKVRWSADVSFGKILEEFSPDWEHEIIDIVKKLNSSDEIITILPVKKSSSRSLANQRQRFVMYDTGLQLRVHVRPQSLGLTEIVYIGAAHRWPHQTVHPRQWGSIPRRQRAR